MDRIEPWLQAGFEQVIMVVGGADCLSIINVLRGLKGKEFHLRRLHKIVKQVRSWELMKSLSEETDGSIGRFQTSEAEVVVTGRKVFVKDFTITAGRQGKEE